MAIAEKFSVISVLQLADEALIKKTAGSTAAGWLDVLNAPGQLQLTRRLHLTSYEVYAGCFLGHMLGVL